MTPALPPPAHLPSKERGIVDPEDRAGHAEPQIAPEPGRPWSGGEVSGQQAELRLPTDGAVKPDRAAVAAEAEGVHSEQVGLRQPGSGALLANCVGCPRRIGQVGRTV